MDGSTRRAEAWLTGREPTMAGRRRGQIIQAPNCKTTWTIRISLPADVEGKRKTWNKTVHGTRKDAERALTRALSDLDQGRLEDPSRMPLADWLDEWMESKRQDLRGRSLESYQVWIQLYLVPTLGRIRLAELKPRDVQRAIVDLANGTQDRPPLAPQTLRNAFGRLRQALAAAVKLRLIPSNPASDTTLPKVPRTGPKRVLTEEESSRMVGAVGEHRLGAMWLLSLATALRPGEALALKWEDVDWENARLHVRHSLWKPRAKGSAPVLTPPKNATSNRVLPLSPALLFLLKRHKARQAAERLAAGNLWQDNGLMFPRPDGTPMVPGTASSAFKSLLERAGLGHLTPHGLRHTAATTLIRAGIDPAHVAAQLGHSSVKTTLETYVKTSEDRLRDGADLLASIIGLPSDPSTRSQPG